MKEKTDWDYSSHGNADQKKKGRKGCFESCNFAVPEAALAAALLQSVVGEAGLELGVSSPYIQGSLPRHSHIRGPQDTARQGGEA